MCKCGENHFEKKIADKYITRCRADHGDECLVQKFLADQAKLPPWRRSKTVMISCPCKVCNKYTL